MLTTLINPAPAVSVAPARVTLLRLQDGLYTTYAMNAEASRANAGEVVPTLVHTTGNSVPVVDPGPYTRRGHRLIAAIRHITAEPIRWVVSTHAHPEHVLANAAFARPQPHPAFLASAATADLMRQRCETCLARLTAMLSARVMHETEIVYPEPALRDGDWLRTGKTVWQIHACTAAHSASDTVLHASQRGVLCTDGLAYLQRIPDLQDGSLAGWCRALHALVQLPANIVVGTAIGTPARTLRPTFTYLDMLDSTVARAIEGGGDAARTLAYVPDNAYRDWRNFHPHHALNVGRAWRELEDRWMQSAPSA